MSKIKLIGFYHEHGYNIHEVSDGKKLSDEPVYQAGNSPYDSSMMVPVERGESLDTLKKWCEQTGKEMAAEQGVEWGGCERESDPFEGEI